MNKIESEVDDLVSAQTDTKDEIQDWRILSERIEHDGEHARLATVQTQTPTRANVCWTVVKRKSAVVVAARTIEGKWLLIRQERIPICETICEFPAGQIDGDSIRNPDLLLETVWRELQEETGWRSGPDTVLTSLGHFFPSAGFTDEKCHLYLAENLLPPLSDFQVDPDEGILECCSITTGELREMVAAGEIRDANTLAAFARMSARGLLDY